ncbi:MAG: hypothetical protein HZA19_01180 [Nitrospirae bacterium]|nr:hypothetical protein [Nitrospirota bacterium]
MNRFQILQIRFTRLLAVLWVTVLLGGQALACFSPLMEEMDGAASMPCCTADCVKETGPEELQEACHPGHEAVHWNCIFTESSLQIISRTAAGSDYSNYPGLSPPTDLVELPVCFKAVQAKEFSLPKPDLPVKLYLFTKTLLI